MTIKPSAIAADLLRKSGIIRIAALVELWTNWGNYVDSGVPRPAFRQLRDSSSDDLVAVVGKHDAFDKVLKNWSFSRGPVTGLNIGGLDQVLDEKRRPLALWKRLLFHLILLPLWLLAVYTLMHVVSGIWTGLFYDLGYGDHSADLAQGLTGILLIIGIIVSVASWVRKRHRYGGVARKALHVLKRLRKRLIGNLRRWNEQELMDFAGLVVTLPNWNPKSVKREQGEVRQPNRVEEKPLVKTVENCDAGDKQTEKPPERQSLNRSSSQPSPQPRNPIPEGTRSIKIDAKQVVRDIRAGLDDIALMQKYGLSAKQLTVLYRKLGERGLLKK